ncbi:MAG: hypothetical protein WC052_05305 [Patescibacteria group bacterium]
MTGANFAAYIRLKTKTDSTTLSDANIVLLANPFKDELAMEIAKVNEDFFGTVATQNLVADQRAYPLPVDIVNNVKFIQAKLDGTNWKRLVPFDYNNYDSTVDETTIRLMFANRRPSYELYGSNAVIYSGDAIINVTNGLSIYYMLYPADLSTANLASSSTLDALIGLPRQVNELLARRVIIAYKSSQDKPIPLDEKELKYGADLTSALAALSPRTLDMSVQAQVPDSNQIGDNGYNY